MLPRRSAQKLDSERAPTHRLLVLVVVSLYRKVRGNEFWIIRILRSSRGSYLHPHLSIAWQIWTVVFLCGELPRTTPAQL